LTRSPPFTRTFALWHYELPINQWVAGLKFKRNLVYARLMGRLFARHLMEGYRGGEMPQCIVPVPLHRARLRQRGFNQAMEIARPLAKHLGVPLRPQACVRTVATQPQSDLPAKLRKRNVKGAFEVRADMTGAHVALVDDVMTTGQTLTELTETLIKTGVMRVDLWVCARAV
jgi:ComF family protein